MPKPVLLVLPLLAGATKFEPKPETGLTKPSLLDCTFLTALVNVLFGAVYSENADSSCSISLDGISSKTGLGNNICIHPTSGAVLRLLNITWFQLL